LAFPGAVGAGGVAIGGVTVGAAGAGAIAEGPAPGAGGLGMLDGPGMPGAAGTGLRLTEPGAVRLSLVLTGGALAVWAPGMSWTLTPGVTVDGVVGVVAPVLAPRAPSAGELPIAAFA
jgi:hypothetical protein